MSMNIGGVNSAAFSRVQRIGTQKRVSAETKIKETGLQEDVFESSNKTKRTKEEKQKILKSARQKGAGWSILGGIITTAYYGLRSDKTVAKKFDLDAEKDKDLIKQVKREQTIWSLTGAVGLGVVGLIVASAMNSENIEVE